MPSVRLESMPSGPSSASAHAEAPNSSTVMQRASLMLFGSLVPTSFLVLLCFRSHRFVRKHLSKDVMELEVSGGGNADVLSQLAREEEAMQQHSSHASKEEQRHINLLLEARARERLRLWQECERDNLPDVCATPGLAAILRQRLANKLEGPVSETQPVPSREQQTYLWSGPAFAPAPGSKNRVLCAAYVDGAGGVVQQDEVQGMLPRVPQLVQGSGISSEDAADVAWVLRKKPAATEEVEDSDEEEDDEVRVQELKKARRRIRKDLVALTRPMTLVAREGQRFSVEEMEKKYYETLKRRMWFSTSMTERDMVLGYLLLFTVYVLWASLVSVLPLSSDTSLLTPVCPQLTGAQSVAMFGLMILQGAGLLVLGHFIRAAKAVERTLAQPHATTTNATTTAKVPAGDITFSAAEQLPQPQWLLVIAWLFLGILHFYTTGTPLLASWLTHPTTPAPLSGHTPRFSGLHFGAAFVGSAEYNFYR